MGGGPAYIRGRPAARPRSVVNVIEILLRRRYFLQKPADRMAQLAGAVGHVGGSALDHGRRLHGVADRRGHARHVGGHLLRLGGGLLRVAGDFAGGGALLFDRFGNDRSIGVGLFHGRRQNLDGVGGPAGGVLHRRDLAGDVLGRPRRLGGERFHLGRDCRQIWGIILSALAD